MKKIIPYFIITFLTFSLFAQDVEETSFKNNFLGGSINYSLTKIDDNRLGDSEFFTSAIHIGRRFSKTSGFGLRVFYNSFDSNQIRLATTTSIEEIIQFRSTTWRFGIFYRQYLNINSKLFVILEPNASYLILDSTENDIPDESERGINIGLNLIPQYRITDRWNLFVNLGGVNFESVENTRFVDDSRSIKKNFSNFSYDFRLRNILLGAEWLF